MTNLCIVFLFTKIQTQYDQLICAFIIENENPTLDEWDFRFVDMTMDLKEVSGVPVAKRGRLPGILANDRLVRIQ